MLDVITKEEFQIWRGTPLTQKMFKYCSDRAEFIKTAWVSRKKRTIKKINK